MDNIDCGFVNVTVRCPNLHTLISIAVLPSFRIPRLSILCRYTYIIPEMGKFKSRKIMYVLIMGGAPVQQAIYLRGCTIVIR